jgi:hypothetical protein
MEKQRLIFYRLSSDLHHDVEGGITLLLVVVMKNRLFTGPKRFFN